MSSATSVDPPPCTHPSVLPGRSATQDYDICATCGARVYNTIGPRMTMTITKGPDVPDPRIKPDKGWRAPPGAYGWKDRR